MKYQVQKDLRSGFQKMSAEETLILKALLQESLPPVFVAVLSPRQYYKQSHLRFCGIEILPELIFQNIKTSRSTISIIKDSQYLKCNFFRMLLPLIILIYAYKSVYPDLDHLRSAWYEYLRSLFQVPLSPETDSDWYTRHFHP